MSVTSRRLLAFAEMGLVAIASCSLVGCQPKDLAIDGAKVAPDAPTRAVLVASHNARVAHLRTTHSDGVVILRWTDERGDHTDQGDIEFWQTEGLRTAMVVSKLGERGLWLGSNDSEWWLFDLLDKDHKTLYRGTHDQVGDRLGAIGVSPLGLLDVFGLSSIDEVNDADDAPTYDSARRAWVIEGAGRGGRVRYAFDHESMLPTHIELLDSHGAIAAMSDLSRWESVAVDGVAVMARPKMPLTIEIRRAGEDADAIVGEVKITLNETESKISEKTLKNIFDIDRLTTSMRPDVIEIAGAGGE